MDSSTYPLTERWFVTYADTVDEEHAQFGPLATKNAAIHVRSVIEVVEGHETLWVTRDDHHPMAYERDLTAPRAAVHVSDANAERA